ncbi:MAG: helix-turn-helix transcriptional regulator [Gulosibacter sp.]|uniref:helix-turn-helix transcriptional regulator n=1 Tax=Gulosibacter sp. TaxID=2817531 RepID=UPI003F924FFB
MRDFVVRSEPLLTPVQVAERVLIETLSKTDAEDGNLLTFRGMPGSGVDRVLQTALEYARENGWLDFFVTLVPWEREVPYSALERVCLKMSGLRYLLEELSPERDPVDLGRQVLKSLDEHFDQDERKILMIFDHLEYCDPLSSVVFRYIVMRATARGANFVLGDSLAFPVDLGDELRQAVYTEPNAHLFVLPELSASDIVAVIGQRAGTGIAIGEGERVRRLTGGRFEAVNAYLNSVSEEHLADLAAIRTLPSLTSARMPGAPPLRLAELSETMRLAAEVCALQPDGVSMQTLKLVSNRLGVPFSVDTAVDGNIVVMNSLTGMLHLYDPLSAPDLLERTDEGRLRVIHSALADLTFGNESRIQSVLATPTIDQQIVTRILDTSADLEANGNAQEALELLDVAVERARTCPENVNGYKQLLRKFGHVFLRQFSPVQYQERIGDFAKFAESDADFGFMYLCLRTVKAHGRLEARDLRLEYMAQPAESVDHEFMQAEISRLELLSAAQTGPETIPAALQDVQARFGALVDREPDDPELKWINARGRLLSIGSLVLAFSVVYGVATNADEEARKLVGHALEFPDESSDALDALTAAGLVLGSMGRIDEASEIVSMARARHVRAASAALIGGQLDVLDLDLAQRRGDWDAMRSMIDDAYVRAFDGMDMPTRIVVPAFKSWLLAVDSTRDEAERYLTVAKDADKYIYPGHAMDMMVLADAEITRLRDGAEAALNVLEDADALSRNQLSRRLLGMRIELLAQTGDHETMAELWNRIQAIHESKGAQDTAEFAWLEGLVLIGRGETDAAREVFAGGIREARSKFVHAKCHLQLANLYAGERGGRESAMEHFKQARIAFRAIGAKVYEDEAVDQLQKLTSSGQERLAALTPRERQVATLAARGWRNKEIARELSIGVATVAFHMSNALQKLGVAKRSELSSVIG